MTTPIVINDGTPQSRLVPPGAGRGYRARDYARHPYGAVGFTVFEDAFVSIPESEWVDRERDMEANRSFAYHVFADRLGHAPKNQQQTNYCHGYSAAMCVMIQRAAAGLPIENISGSGIAGPTVNFRNAGAWIMDDLRTMREIGCCTTEFAPENGKTGRSQFREGWEADAATRKVVEVYELRPNHLGDTMTALLLGFAIADGRNHWSHATCTCRSADGGKRIGIINSWGDWGDRGFGWLEGGRRYCSEQYAVRVTTA